LGTVPGFGSVRRRRRELLERLAIPEPWRGTVEASLSLIDDLDAEIDRVNRELRLSGAEHPYIPLGLTVPGIGWVLAFTIAAEIGDIHRFATPKKLCGYTGLCPRVNQSGDKGPPRPADQARPALPALGDARSDHARAPAPGLRRPLPAHQAPARQAARPQQPRLRRTEPAEVADASLAMADYGAKAGDFSAALEWLAVAARFRVPTPEYRHKQVAWEIALGRCDDDASTAAPVCTRGVRRRSRR
jgi:transposase